MKRFEYFKDSFTGKPCVSTEKGYLFFPTMKQAKHYFKTEVEE